MVGEWLFSVAAFPGTAPDPDALFVDDLARGLPQLGESPEKVREKLLRIRDVDVPAYLTALEESFPWHEAAVVGFTSTFQQNAASFALARRLKQRLPHVVTVFGGANFDGEMGPELVRAVECIDIAVMGEGEQAFPRLLGALAAGTGLDAVPGLARRQDGQVLVTPPVPPAVRLDDLPAPDYDEYFQRAEELGLLPRAGPRTVWLPIETARGCWWGAKHHCTFCGLNGTAMSFRPKSPERVLGELAQQARKYRSFRFEAVDNIMDMTYLTKLFPVLRDTETGYELFYEVKSSLRREQLRLMAQAGVRSIQPGIESLSSNVLRLIQQISLVAHSLDGPLDTLGRHRVCRAEGLGEEGHPQLLDHPPDGNDVLRGPVRAGAGSQGARHRLARRRGPGPGAPGRARGSLAPCPGGAAPPAGSGAGRAVSPGQGVGDEPGPD